MPPRRKRTSDPLVPLARHLIRSRRNRTAGGAVVLLVVLALIAADRLWLYSGGDLGRYDGKTFTVVRIVDGDTLDVAAPDVDPRTGDRKPATRIRLWGIDTPETHNTPTGEPQPFGPEATAFARDLCAGQTVRLLLEPHDTRDRYGRLLAFVYLPDGSMLNERLLAAGLARAEDRFSHRWLERFAHLEKQARHEKAGLWGAN